VNPTLFPYTTLFRSTSVVFLGDIADMRGQDHVRRRAQRVVDRQRLLVVDVEPGISEASLLQCADDRFGIAYRPARGVDEDCTRRSEEHTSELQSRGH